MKSLAERQADREKRRAAEAEARKVSGTAPPETDADDGDETGKTKKGGRKGVTTLKDAGVEGGAGTEGDGSPGAGNGGGNPFGNS